MGKRLIAMGTAILLAALGTVVLVAYVRSAEARALAGEETVEVLVLSRDVPRGTPVDALADAVRVERIPVKIRPDDSVADLGALEGRVTAIDLVSGEALLGTRFVQPETLTTVQVPAGLLQATVRLAPERAVGGNLSPGDLVAVVASLTADVDEADDGTEESSEVDSTHLVLHKVLVTRVQRQQTATASAPTDGEAASDAAPQGDLLITLAVAPSALETLVFAAEHGSVWLGNQPEDAPEDGTRIVTRENVYR